MMNSLAYQRFLKERYHRDEGNFKVYNTYTPNYKRQVVTNKFYSKYEVIDLAEAEQELLAKIKIAKESTPRQRKNYPETVNQTYGWYSERLEEFDRNDPRLNFPYVLTPFIRHEINIKADICNKRITGSTYLRLK